MQREADDRLALRAERAMTAERRAFVASTSAARPEAAVLDVADGCAIYTGHGLFSNRVMGLGLEAGVSDTELNAIEQFYRERGTTAQIEVASVASPNLLDLLARRRYRLKRFRNIYARTELNSPPSTSGAVGVETVDDANRAQWSQVLVDGFGYQDPAGIRLVREWNDALLAVPGLTAFVGVIDGESVAAASVLIDGRTAVLGGAATLERHRRRGAQSALISARLRLARDAGCDLAVVTADPGSISARNSERAGFRLVCTHAVMAAEQEPKAGRDGTT